MVVSAEGGDQVDVDAGLFVAFALCGLPGGFAGVDVAAGEDELVGVGVAGDEEELGAAFAEAINHHGGAPPGVGACVFGGECASG